MNAYRTLADLGGEPGHGSVVPEPEGDLWHASWEPRAMALTVAMGATGSWNIDSSRAARETLPAYRRLTYYEIWVHALVVLLKQRAMLADDELEAACAKHPAPPVARVLMAADVAAAMARGSPTGRPTTTAARFAVGDAVRLRAEVVDHHTRLPGYARGKRGTVQSLHGAHVFADTNAQGQGEQPRWLYTVAFDGRELWGDEAVAQKLVVSIDAWEPYLEPA